MMSCRFVTLLLTAVLFAETASAQGIVTVLAGSPGTGGHFDGTGSGALFLSPKAMSVDSAGNVYTVDNFCGTIRKKRRLVTASAYLRRVSDASMPPRSAASAMDRLSPA